jgi:hypothetical protein
MNEIGMNDTWFRFSIADGVDGSRPGIYEIIIDGVGCYIGKCRDERRPRRDYANNVAKMLAGKPWRKGNARSFRVIHHALLEARTSGRGVSICMIENVERHLLNAREDELIAKRRHEAAAAGLRVFNAT